jgi:phage/conjugal plasmid C-4 type zinc finger TraR family protein
MTDIYDRAQDREAQDRRDALAAQQRRAGLAGRTVADSAQACVTCDEPLSQARREAYPGVQECVDCKSRMEGLDHARRAHQQKEF